MAILVYVRCTEDWASYTYEQLLQIKKSGIVISNPNFLLSKIKKWDRTFSMPYFQYRQVLTDLATSTWNKYKICKSFEELSDTAQEDDIICPTDDDDWFRPDLAEKLPRSMRDTDLLTWDQIVVVPGGGLHRWSECHNDLSTNNYAVRWKACKQLNRDHQRLILDNEWRLLDIWCKHYRFGIKLVMNDLLSCYLWHTGSVSRLLGSPLEYQKILDRVIQDPAMRWVQELYNKFTAIHNALCDEEIMSSFLPRSLL